MTLKNRSAVFAAAVSVTVLGATFSSAALVPYSVPTAVNLLRRVDQAGNLGTVTASTVPGYSHGPEQAFDAGIQPWRIDGHGSSEFLRIALPEIPALVQNVDIFWRGGFHGADYTVKASDTGFGSMTTLVNVTGNANDHPNYNIPTTPIKYLELNATGFAHSFYYITYELSATSSTPVYQRTGYNMLAESGKLAPITADMQSGINLAVSRVADNDINTYITGTNTAAPNDNNFFVLPLNNSTELMAISLGMYEDQNWTDAQVYLSNDAAYNYDGGTQTWPGMTWNQVFNFNDAGGTVTFGGAHITFAPQFAKFIRVDFPADGRAGGAMTEVQLFETYIPEPGLAGVGLVVGMMGMAGRRRRA